MLSPSCLTCQHQEKSRRLDAPGRVQISNLRFIRKVIIAQICANEDPHTPKGPLAPASCSRTWVRSGTCGACREMMKEKVQGCGVRATSQWLGEGWRLGMHTGRLALCGKRPWNSVTANSNLYRVARSVGQESGPELRGFLGAAGISLPEGLTGFPPSLRSCPWGTSAPCHVGLSEGTLRV